MNRTSGHALQVQTPTACIQLHISDSYFHVLQQSLSPSPVAQGTRPAASMSPVGVSPSTDLAAQAGAMLIDNPSARFNSPCHRYQSDAGRNCHEPAPLRPPSRQHSSSEAPHSSAPPPRSAAESGHPQTVRPSEEVPRQNLSAQDSLNRDDEDHEWCSDVANAVPESSSEELLIMRKFPPSGFTSEQAALTHNSAHPMGSLSLPPVGAYLPATGFSWDSTRLESVDARAAALQSGDAILSSVPAPFLPTLVMQRQHAQLLPSHTAGQPVPSGASAMVQLALSTAATTDLLAGMAANSSQAYPHPASDLILAASATLQAFARAAQSNHGSFSGALPNGATVISQGGQGFGLLPGRQQQQQLAFMQQQWQQRLGWM